MNLLGALIVVVFGFFFATVSSRMVGLIGSSNNPVSGMAIATIITTILLKVTGIVGTTGMTGAICIGVIASAAVIGFVLYLMNAAWEFGGEEIPAPQATMMKMLVEGIMNAELPWALILTGVGVAIVVEIVGVQVMPFAVGMYLPFSLSAGIMAGGIVRWFMERRKNVSDEERRAGVDRGVLYTSGLIAGEGLMGVVLAALAAGKVNTDLSGIVNLGSFGSIVLFLALLGTLVKVCLGKKKA